MEAECVFCRITQKKLPSAQVYEDKYVLAFLDIAPISPGHCLVIPKKHFSRLEDCPPSLISKISENLGIIAKAVIQAVSADDYNLLNNNGPSAGQLVDHLHFHIIPRKSDDGVFNRWSAGEYSTGQIDQLAEKIRQKL